MDPFLHLPVYPGGLGFHHKCVQPGSPGEKTDFRCLGHQFHHLTVLRSLLITFRNALSFFGCFSPRQTRANLRISGMFYSGKLSATGRKLRQSLLSSEDWKPNQVLAKASFPLIHVGGGIIFVFEVWDINYE